MGRGTRWGCRRCLTCRSRSPRRLWHPRSRMCRRCRSRRLLSLRLGLVWSGCTDEEEPMTTMSLARFEADQVQVRRADVTGVDEDTGVVEARIVPYEHEVLLADGLWEVF